MKIPAGAPGWDAACTPDERAATAALAASRGKWSAVWAALAVLGVLCAGGVLVTGLLPVPWSAGAVSRGAVAVGLGALVLVVAQPLAVLGEGVRNAGVTVWLTVVVAVLCVLCGLSTLWLKVILRPVRTGR